MWDRVRLLCPRCKILQPVFTRAADGSTAGGWIIGVVPHKFRNADCAGSAQLVGRVAPPPRREAPPAPSETEAPEGE